MKYLDLAWPHPEYNLACDEALLDWCEAGYPDEILRLWEPPNYFVVLGYSNKIDAEVRQTVCQKKNIPILRRCSGGGTVLQGPGCWNYSLILRIAMRPELQSVSQTNAYVMNAHRQALQPCVPAPIQIEGHTDLALAGQKFSGNSQRRRRQYLLFHGTFFLRFDLALVSQLLPYPSKAPPYRRQRPHHEFLTNLQLPSSTLKQALQHAWHAQLPLQFIPTERIERLVKEKYATQEWNAKF